MNQLKVISLDGQLVTESRQVAEMIERPHNELMKTIRTYVEYLGQGNFAHTDFFIGHEYEDAQGKKRPCYLITKKGCDMVANKMTGEKGVLFTAAYVTRFEEMEQVMHQPRVLTEKEQLRASMKLSLDTSEEVEVLKIEVNDLKEKVENQITIDHGEQRRLQKAIGSKVYGLESISEFRPKLFKELYREIKDRFGVASYKDVKRKDLQMAIRYVDAWIPRKVA